MKKTLLTFSLLLALIVSVKAQIVITEIMYNPPESGADTLEFIELYNNTGNTVDLTGWTFSKGITYAFPSGATVAGGAYFTLAVRASAFQTVYGYAPQGEWTGNGNALSNNGEPVEIMNGGGNVIDFVSYLSAAPWPTGSAGTGASIVLCDVNSDNSMPVNWQSATTGTGVIVNGNEIKANPGAASGCSGANNLSATNDVVNVTSGQSQVVNVLGNDLLPNPVTSLTVLTAPQHGSTTVNGLADITYSPQGGYCGDDAFQYIVCDAGACDTATVTVHVICYNLYSIFQISGENAEGVADSLGVFVELQATVYGVNLRPLNNNQPALLFTIIDNSGQGISVSSLNGNLGYTVQEKDKIIVRGKIGQFNGLTEVQANEIIKISGNNPLVVPTPVTTHTEATESKLIKINNLHFVDAAAEWTTGVGPSGFTARAVSDDNPLDTIIIRIDRDVETYNAPVPSQPFNLTGIGGQFDNTNPFTSGYQILPRYNADISTLNATHNADFSAQVQLSPNPATDVLVVRSTVVFDKMAIYSIEGQLLKSYVQPALNEQLPVNALPAGTYFLRFEKDGAAWTTRFVKI